jgi:hypothetical protein
MTAEEKREQLLKRILPGLAITIIYFVFVNNMLTEKMKKAETDYKNLILSGISKEALPGALSQQQQTQQQFDEVQKKVTELQENLKKMVGFLSSSGSSSNAAMGEVTSILDKYQVKLRKDEKAQFPEAQLSPALKEVWQAMKPADPAAVPKSPTAPAPPPAPAETTAISVHHLWLKGSYISMYKALTAIAQPKLQVLPISLTMQMPEVDSDNSGELEWELILWM